MNLNFSIWFPEDVFDRLTALAQSNERTLRLAEGYGMDPAVARLCAAVYQGCIEDIAVAFGVDLGAALIIPARKEMTYERQVDCGTGYGGILEAIAGDCPGVSASDGQGACAGAGKTDSRNGGEKWTI